MSRPEFDPEVEWEEWPPFKEFYETQGYTWDGEYWVSPFEQKYLFERVDEYLALPWYKKLFTRRPR